MTLDQAHEYSSNHKKMVLNSKKVGCFYCLRTYRPSKIKEWIDAGETALCGFCGIDSVLPSFYGMTGPEFLQAMYDKWFKLNPNNYTYYKMDNGNVAAIIEVKAGKETKTWEWVDED
jgi:hypothetical protein